MDVSISALDGGIRETSATRFAIVANRTGGQGKTLVAHLLAWFLRESDPGFRAMCADSLEIVEQGRPGVSKLGRSVSDVIELGAGPSPTEVQNNPRLAFEFWDSMVTPLLDGTGFGCVLDVGANVVDAILDWGRSADLQAIFEDRVVVDLVIPAVATFKSLADAADVASSAVRPGGLPVRSVFLVENQWQGPFSQVAASKDYGVLREIVDRTGGSVATLPRYPLEALALIERDRLFFGDVATMDYHAIADRFSMSRIKASREQLALGRWFTECRASLSAAGLCDHRPAVRGADYVGGASRDRRPD
jgi:hypothetical protein